jgi:hypothetical protein
MYSYQSRGVLRYMFLISAPPNLAPGGTDDTVPHYFCRDHVSCMCGEFVRIIDKVATNSDPNSIWVVFLGAVVDDNLCVRDSLICWDVVWYTHSRCIKNL